MKCRERKAVSPVEILANDHFTAIPYDCSELTGLASDGVVKAGTIVPSNDANAIGVLLYDVTIDENPNAAAVVHGFIKLSALPEAVAAAAKTALKGITFVDDEQNPNPMFTVTYDANGGTGEVTDSSSPYAYGAEVTVKAGSTLTGPDSKTFSGWALTKDAAVKNDDYDPSDKFTITSNITLYAVYA